MQEKSHTKEMKGVGVKRKDDYHFSGGGEYNPVMVEAGSQEEAVKEWEKVRVSIKKEE